MTENVNHPKLISLFDIIKGWDVIFKPSQDDPLKCIDEIDLDEYCKLRTQINDAFKVGNVALFDGVIEDETEYGDVTDVMIELLYEKYPPDKCGSKSNTITLDVEKRAAWRDELIKELDEMVER
jgi:hypothetical protein